MSLSSSTAAPEHGIRRRERWEAITTVPLVVLGAGFILFYSLYVLVPDDGRILHVIVAVELLLTWALFLIDYVVRFALTPRHLRGTFVRKNPIDLLSVMLPVFRAFRVISLLRRIPYFHARTGSAIRTQVITYAAAYAVMFVYFIALATLHAERDAPGATITNLGDALWWAVVTLATVGYGDTYPITTVGRLYAVLLMIGGIAIVGTSSAVVISYLSERMAGLRTRVEPPAAPGAAAPGAAAPDTAPQDASAHASAAAPADDVPVFPALSQAKGRLDDNINRFRIEE